jgi:hypothetical protein
VGDEAMSFFDDDPKDCNYCDSTSLLPGLGVCAACHEERFGENPNRKRVAWWLWRAVTPKVRKRKPFVPAVRIKRYNKWAASEDGGAGYDEYDYDYNDFETRAWLRENDPCNG